MASLSRSLLPLSLVVVFLTVGCGDDDVGRCVPGEVVACGTCGGAQTCLPDGTYGPCDCADGGTEDAGVDSGMSDSGMSDSGMASDSGMDASDSGVVDSGRDASDSGMVDSGTDASDSGMVDSGTDASDSGMSEMCDDDGATVRYVVGFQGIPEIMGAVADGFNVDDRISGEADPLGCFIEDYTSPLGERGIDNSISQLAPVLESATGTALDVGGSLTLTVSDIDSFEDDPCVVVRTGGVEVFGEIRDGVLTASGFTVAFEVLGASVDIEDGHLRADITARSLDGLAGGGATVDDLVRTFGSALAGVSPALIRSVLESVADLSPDRSGVCQSVSGAAYFRTPRAPGG